MPRYIDADALKAKYKQMLPEIGDGYHKETLQDVLFELDYAPTISPNEVRGVGKWIHFTRKYISGVGDEGVSMIRCSVCDYTQFESSRSAKTYCPNCGAKMEVSEDD